MRAVRLHEIGGPKNLRIDDVPVPVPGEGEVLVKIESAAFNRRDVFITQGLYPRIELPVILGSDGAGIRQDTGEEVVIDPMLDWGDDPHVWDPKKSSIVGMPHPGTFAQYVAVPKQNVYAKPKHLTMEQAAALPLAGLTAFRAVFTRGRLQAGETILIPGAGGGVQTFALLFAKHAGARAIVTSGTPEKLERAKALGADIAIDYNATPEWHKELRSVGPIDLVVDSSGGDTIAKSMDAVKPGGRIVVYGGTRFEATIKLFPLFWKHIDLLGTSMGSPQDFANMVRFVDETKAVPVVDEVFQMNRVVEAAEKMNGSTQFGKIVLAISE